MSYYYNYYVGYKIDGKVYPFGPYNSTGKLKEVITKSRSFASDLHEVFYRVAKEEISDELRKEFEYEDWNGNKSVNVKMLPIKELPSGSYIKRGFFLVEDVLRYEDPDNDYFDGFYEYISPAVYASMVQNEVQFGKPERKLDDCDNWYCPKAASDYMYYAYPDYNSKEYEAEMVRSVAYMLNDYSELPKDAILLALETEG